MSSRFRFNKWFGLKWYDRLDGTYYSILILSTVFTYTIIAIIGNLNYNRLAENADRNIRERYKEFIAQILIDEEPGEYEVNSSLLEAETVNLPISADNPSTPLSRKKERQQIVEKIIENTIFQASKGKDSFLQQLPEPDEPVLTYDDAASSLSDRSYDLPRFSSRIGNPVDNMDTGPIDQPADNLFNYIVKRQGSIYIDLTDELTEDPNTLNGYRDPDEIERVISKYQPMIEHCFRKEARISHIVRGYVKVEFRISYEGHVIPESIKIVNSTVGSKRVDQCIKNYIKRWRSFARLDESMGMTRVTQKFIFN